MALILLHSSKTMRQAEPKPVSTTTQLPSFMPQANEIAHYVRTLSVEHIARTMKLSSNKAAETYELFQSWDSNRVTGPAIDTFLGDIYSGLQATSFTEADRNYANEHLFILSGLYGVLRALDEIQPYRLEMGYRLPGNAHDTHQSNITSLYEYWSDTIARALPAGEVVINLSAVEYTKSLFKYYESRRVISPKFLTVSPRTGKPTFVTVHAKIARGAFAHWVIKHQVEDMAKLVEFDELGYLFDAASSTEDEPVFVAKEFQGLGLSVRLQ